MREKIPHRLRRLSLRVRRHMSVSIQREARGVVPEHGTDRFYIVAVLERERREGMTQIVKAYSRQPRAFQNPLQSVQHAVR